MYNKTMVRIYLAIMVKNEEATILKTLESCRAYIAGIKIYDTGSADMTLDMARAFASEHPHLDVQIKQGGFVDFAVSRNVLMDMVDDDVRVDYALLLDANDELQGGHRLLDMVEADNNVSAGFMLRQKWQYASAQNDVYFNIRLVRARCLWRYHGAVHEYLASSSSSTTISKIEHADIVIYQDRSKDCESSIARFHRDRDMLRRDALIHPDDPRTVFYLAQTCACLNLDNEAYSYYEMRVDMGGFEEERFHAMLRLGDLAKKMNMSPDVYCTWWQRALDHSERAEPCVRLADHYLFSVVPAKHYMACMYTTVAVRAAYPQCDLFVDHHVYDYVRHYLHGVCAFYVGEFKSGADACTEALRVAQLQDDHNKITINQTNLAFYTFIE